MTLLLLFQSLLYKSSLSVSRLLASCFLARRGKLTVNNKHCVNLLPKPPSHAAIRLYILATCELFAQVEQYKPELHFADYHKLLFANYVCICFISRKQWMESIKIHWVLSLPPPNPIHCTRCLGGWVPHPPSSVQLAWNVVASPCYCSQEAWYLAPKEWQQH